MEISSQGHNLVHLSKVKKCRLHKSLIIVKKTLIHRNVVNVRYIDALSYLFYDNTVNGIYISI